METTFYAPRQKLLNWNVVILIGLLILGVFLLILANLPLFETYASLLIAVAFFLAIPFFYVLYQNNNARQIRYVLSGEQLKVHWGVNSLKISLRAIEWAHQLTEFEDEMPLPRWHLPGVYLQNFLVRGMGKTRFVATDVDCMILIKAAERFIVVSPQEPTTFLAQLTERKSLSDLTSEAIEEEHFFSLAKKVWQDKWAKGLIIAGLTLLVLLWAEVGIIVAIRPQVTWVTLEEVRSGQLWLLPIFGTFLWMTGLVLSFFVLINQAMEKLLAYMVLLSSGLSCLVLIVAALMMSL